MDHLKGTPKQMVPEARKAVPDSSKAQDKGPSKALDCVRQKGEDDKTYKRRMNAFYSRIKRRRQKALVERLKNTVDQKSAEQSRLIATHDFLQRKLVEAHEMVCRIQQIELRRSVFQAPPDGATVNAARLLQSRREAGTLFLLEDELRPEAAFPSLSSPLHAVAAIRQERLLECVRRSEQARRLASQVSLPRQDLTYLQLSREARNATTSAAVRRLLDEDVQRLPELSSLVRLAQLQASVTALEELEHESPAQMMTDHQRRTPMAFKVNKDQHFNTRYL